ncbi:peptide/nickel transport system permease protein [Tamaricihabitans halophyticus]|uniref:Peptide/nickel transport system permease protein n=1 Tax=Tamaricihabitans halophyticus TaxID=1262583 RepID=A0A4R2QW17_9PSEU|nr:ABC transporter permease subunit [Tamaricihabitans halophyticus]TCP54273.1 peptide/nickel transport system permease protein [Tamaricihabitans halophyticus]
MTLRTLGAGTARTAGTVLASCLAVLLVVAALPWLSGTDPARTVLRMRFAEREPDQQALEAIRAELDIPANPLLGVLHWLAGLPRGDLGISWVSRQPVGPEVASALGVSATLAGTAATVAVLLAAAVLLPGLWRATRTGKPLGRTSGAVAGLLGSLPEFVLAALLLAVVAVHWGWLPTFGWSGVESLPLPALALGVPAGGLLARALSGGLDATIAEPWVRTWRANGFSRPQVLLALLRRGIAVAIPQLVLLFVGLLGSAVTVEAAFAIPGLGQTALDGLLSQDLPLVQGCVLVLILLGLGLGGAGMLAHRALLGSVLHTAEVPAAIPVSQPNSKLPAVLAVLLGLIVLAGLPRDGSSVLLTERLAAPSAAHPLGTDAVGRDILARFSSGALLSIGTAVLVSAVCLLIGLLVGLASRRGRAGAPDVLNALPPVLVGIVIAAAFGSGLFGAAIAVVLVGWIPLAVHARTLAVQARGSGYVRAATLGGARRGWILRRHLLPSVFPQVLRHAVVRVPHNALGIAALSFLGLGAPHDSAEWGAMLAQSLGYLERAPWTIAGPTIGLALLGMLAGSIRGTRN